MKKETRRHEILRELFLTPILAPVILLVILVIALLYRWITG